MTILSFLYTSVCTAFALLFRGFFGGVLKSFSSHNLMSDLEYDHPVNNVRHHHQMDEMEKTELLVSLTCLIWSGALLLTFENNRVFTRLLIEIPSFCSVDFRNCSIMHENPNLKPFLELFCYNKKFLNWFWIFHSSKILVLVIVFSTKMGLKKT